MTAPNADAIDTVVAPEQARRHLAPTAAGPAVVGSR
jgi:hypothetical protein